MNQNEFKNCLLENFLSIDSIDNVLQQIESYKILLQQENKKYNLTRLDQDEIVYIEYFMQSIIPYKNVDFSKIIDVLDVGSGSGIPGLVLKIIFPHIKLTIIEGNAKKVNFMNLICESLKLTDVTIVHGRAEVIIINKRESFDLVTARAVANLEMLIELLVPFAKVNGLIVIPKSVNYFKEIVDLKKMLSIMDCSLIKISKNDFYDYIHNVILIRKNQKTSLKYPRIWAQIIKGFNYGK